VPQDLSEDGRQVKSSRLSRPWKETSVADPKQPFADLERAGHFWTSDDRPLSAINRKKQTLRWVGTRAIPTSGQGPEQPSQIAASGGARHWLLSVLMKRPHAAAAMTQVQVTRGTTRAADRRCSAGKGHL
jgi:hypothetical protein